MSETKHVKPDYIKICSDYIRLIGNINDIQGNIQREREILSKLGARMSYINGQLDLYERLYGFDKNNRESSALEYNQSKKPKPKVTDKKPK